jgi:hypothetical protein
MEAQLPVKKRPIKQPPGLTQWQREGNRAAIEYRHTPKHVRSMAQGLKAGEMAQEGWHG